MSRGVNLPSWVFVAAGIALVSAVLIMANSERGGLQDILLMVVIGLSGATVLGGLLSRGDSGERDDSDLRVDQERPMYPGGWTPAPPGKGQGPEQDPGYQGRRYRDEGEAGDHPQDGAGPEQTGEGWTGEDGPGDERR